MEQSKRRLIIAIFVLIWLMSIVSTYYVSHKPIMPAQALKLVWATGQIAVAFGICAIAGGLGYRILPVDGVSSLTSLSLQAALGFGVMGIGVMLVGSFIGINSYVGWIGLLLLGSLLWRDVVGWLLSWKEITVLWETSERLGKLIIIGLGLILLATLVTALAPPLSFDTLVYHLALPKIYLDNSRIIYVPRNMFWGMPQLGEMLYTWAMALASAESATVLGWVFGLLSLVGLFGYANRRFGSRAAWIALASLMAGRTLNLSLSWGYVDWLAILYGLCVLVSLDLWRGKRDLRNLVVAGFFTGLSIGVKYTAGVIFLAGLGVIFYRLVKNPKDRSRTITFLLLFSLPVLFISLPWWIKNSVATSNPFYPFFIPAGEMDRFRLEFYPIPLWGDWRDFLLLPWQATIHGIEGAPGYSASIGPLLLALGPLALLSWFDRTSEQRITLSTAAVISIIGLFVWAVASRISGFLIQSRLYFSIFPALAILAGAGFDSLSRLELSGIRLGRVVGAIILLIFGFSTLEVGVSMSAQGAPKVLLGVQSKEDYINENLGWYGPVMKALRELPEDEVVLMLWEPRMFHCTPKCHPDAILDRWIHDRYELSEPLTILESWREEGYTHLLYYRAGADFIRDVDYRYDSSDWEALEWLLDRLPPPTDFGGAYYLYTIEP